MAGYALLAPLLLFALEFSSIRIQEPFVLYRAYLWIPFLFMLMPVLTNSVSNRFFWVSVLAVAAIFATASTDRLNSFSSGYALWDDAVRKLPEVPLPGAERALSNRCREFLVKRELDAAIADCSRALELNSQFRAAYQNRTFAYARKGNFPAAIKDAQTVIERFPHDPDGYTLLGVMYQGAGDVEKAKANFEIACGRQALSGCIRLELMNKSTNSGK